MKYDEYKQRVNYFLKNDNREVNYQNRVVLPFLESLFPRNCVADVSQLTKNWKGIFREQFAGLYTPDLLITNNAWRLKDHCDCRMILEIKTPTARDRTHAEKEVDEYLCKGIPVVLTNCITWEFFWNGQKETINLEQKYSIKPYNFPCDVCSRPDIRHVRWKGENDWVKLKELILKYAK
jgi:hypothetical protein